MILPTAVTFTAQGGQAETDVACKIGCRIIGANALDTAMTAMQKRENESLSISDLVLASAEIDEASGGGWRLEHFIVNLLLGCKEGYIGGDDPTRDRGLLRVFGGRTAPISAGISITIDAPG
jgi:hypothetical protein